MTDRSKVVNIAKTRKVTWDSMDDLTAALTSRVVGQPGIVESIVPYVEMFQAGLSPENRPAGVFLLLGPTGTGKTRTVEALAEALHGSPKSMVKIDCGEFQLEHEVAKLIGAPPGYLGHRETQPLLTQQKLTAATSERSPLSLVLFDEIEKAAPSMARLLLGVLDRGVLRLGDNSSVNFDRSLVFLTSNLGARQMLREISPDFGFQSAGATAGPTARLDEVSRKLQGIGVSAVRRKFSPEFVNRIDQIVTYRPLDVESFAAIVDHEIENLQNHIENRAGNAGIRPGSWNRGAAVAVGMRNQPRVRRPRAEACYTPAPVPADRRHGGAQSRASRLRDACRTLEGWAGSRRKSCRRE
jgi:ATP-dependent Clp protease ATP-binding subunit ClpA